MFFNNTSYLINDNRLSHYTYQNLLTTLSAKLILIMAARTSLLRYIRKPNKLKGLECEHMAIQTENIRVISASRQNHKLSSLR